ncbi:Shwachman-Bodian-Diamond syndrome protein [Methanosarcina sp. MTP4]|uniref:ribosome assembly factor SBDS n=1 Tax=Methanosarcina sp. MTP4 TaxID=1434100 RepID=UPI0006157DB1|nr:ribosome assembly factor SBDS [Methanosarcina sp. MTP4]AKB25434.1 Shwachman-Bodian-Diamond syndrome protein [Methanosarcina sp. MTP4]
MVSLDEAVTARLKRGSKHFEVLVEPEGALAFKRGEEVKLEDVLAVETIFEDANRGDRAAESDIINAFETSDPFEIASLILKNGELQLTAEQRKHILEEKRKKVIYTISRNAINPQTRAPHPPARIERAMEEAKVHIDPLKSVDQLVKITMKAIRPLIPIRFEEINVAVKIPPEYAPKAYGDISRSGSILKEEWQNDGSWVAVVRIPAGIQNDFYSLLNHLTKGEAQTKLL